MYYNTAARAGELGSELRLFRALLGSPIEVVTALVASGGGIFLTILATDAPTHRGEFLTIGGVLTTFGGILISWIASKAIARQQAIDEVGERLDSLSRNLGQVAGQISRSVEQAQTREISPETGFALILQASRLVYGQVNEIAVLRGAAFDSAYLIDTAEQLDGLAQQLSRQLGTSGAPAESIATVRQNLATVRTNLTRVAPVRSSSIADVGCPHCGTTNSVQVGDFPGDTAAAVCSACGKAFNAHRSLSGLFSRPMGRPLGSATVPAVERWNFNCPSCQQVLSVRIDQGQTEIVCTNCFMGLDVDATSRAATATTHYGNSRPAAGGRSGTRPLLPCPTGAELINGMLTNTRGIVAICRRHRQVMEMSWEEWAASPFKDRGQTPPSVG